MKSKFLTLWLAGVLAMVMALPYVFQLEHDVLVQAPLSLPVIALISVVQTAVLLAIAVFFGLKLAKSLNLPVLDFTESKIPAKQKLVEFAKFSVPIGVGTALILAVGAAAFTPFLPKLTDASLAIPAWKALLVSFYGGIVEELLLRLFVMSLFAWVLGKIFRAKEVSKNAAIMWTAIIAASVLFGLGHLPATAAVVALTPIVIVRVILLNGIGGVVFGWLYWKKGLDYAIVAHFSADIVLHVIIPALARLA